MAVNWDLAPRLGDVASSALANYDAGREQARQGSVRHALQNYETDPQGSQAALVGAGEFGAAKTLADLVHEQQVAKQREALIAQYKLDPKAAMEAANANPDTFDIGQHWGTLDTQQRQAAMQHVAGLDRIAQSLKSVPYEEAVRRRDHAANDPNFVAATGLSREQIMGFDPTPENIDRLHRTVLTPEQLAAESKIVWNDRDPTHNQVPTHADGTPLTPQEVAALGGGGMSGATSPAPAGGAPGGLGGAADFATIYHGFTKPQEGGYTASDGNGAPANFGINQKANPDVGDVRNLTPAQAEQIYRERYWGPSGAGTLPAPLAAVQFDTAVNMGVGAAKRLLAQSGGDPQRYLQLREARYRAIAARDPSKAASLDTWLSRNEDLGRFIQGQGAAPAAGGGAQAGELPGTIHGTPKPDPNGTDEPPDPATVRLQAGIYLAKGVLPAMGAGKYAGQWKAAIMKEATAQASALGLDANDIVAGTVSIKAAGMALNQSEKTLAAIQGSEQTVVRNAEYALSLAPKGAGTTGVPIFNNWQQHIRDRVFGSPEVSQFDNAIRTVAEEYAKVMTTNTGSGGVSSDSARNEAYSRLSKSATPQQLEANVAAMKVEMANRIQSLTAVRDGLQSRIRNGYGEGGVASPAPAAAAVATPAARRSAAPHGGFTAAQRKALPTFKGAASRGEQTGTAGNPFVPVSEAEYNDLPPGAHYLHTDGSVRVKR